MFRSASASMPSVFGIFGRRAVRPAVARAARATAGVLLESLERRDLFATVPVIDSSAHSIVFGQGITLTANVGGGATGTVTFLNGGSTLGTAPLDTAGNVKLFTASLPVGAHSIVASYDGDVTHPAGTSAPLAQTVSQAITTTAVTSSAGMLANPILRPDRVVVVIEEDRFANAVGDTAHLPYLNQLAASGLVFNNSHGVGARAQTFGEMNYLALYSGSTHGIADDGPLYSLDGPNLAKSLFDAGLSFGGYPEGLPAAGDVTTVFAPDPANPVFSDVYARYYNPMAMFTDVGAGKTNADVNKPFSSFPSDYATLPTVSFVVPDRAHNTHGSNEVPPFAADPDTYDLLRGEADTWLHDNLDAYAQWARTHNSLLIVTTEGGDRAHSFEAGGTTVVTGDPRLFVGGVNDNYVTHYNVLRTIEDMYGVAPIGDSATAVRLNTDALGRLAPGGPVAQASVAGQVLTYTATVAPLAPAAGTPAGAVQFLVDGVNYGGAVPLTNGTASVSVGGLGAGGHTVSAVYAGSPSHLGSTAWRVAQPISLDGTSVEIASSLATSVAGQGVTFTATVTPGNAGSGTPTGLVTFKDGATILGSATPDAAGRATLSTASLSVGTHSITASYAGDANHAAASSFAFSQIVDLNSATVALTSSAPSAGAGQAVTLTATVVRAGAGSLAPTGTVTFREGSVVLGTAAIGASGQASFTTATLPVGSHAITASYGGDASFGAAASPTLTQTVVANATATSLASSALSATVGELITYTASVTSAAATAPARTGTVTFFDGASRLGAASLDAAGKATFAISFLTAGGHGITAVYSGNANSAGSTSAVLNQQVVAAPTGPANDRFANRLTLTGSAVTATGSNVGATKEAGEPIHGGNVGGKSVWWSWKAPASGVVTIDTLGSSFKTLLGVYTGSTLTALARVTGLPLTVGGAATFTFVAKAGQTYQIAVDGFAGASGSVKLRVTSWTGLSGSAGTGEHDDHTKKDKKKDRKKS
jgi:hypothetical protein